MAVAGPDARPEERAVAAAGPLLLLPVELDVVGRLGGPGAEIPGERIQDRLAADISADPAEPAGLIALQEAEQHTW